MFKFSDQNFGTHGGAEFGIVASQSEGYAFLTPSQSLHVLSVCVWVESPKNSDTLHLHLCI